MCRLSNAPQAFSSRGLVTNDKLLGSNSVTMTDLWLGGDASGNEIIPAAKNNLRLTTQSKRNRLQVLVTVQLRNGDVNTVVDFIDFPMDVI